MNHGSLFSGGGGFDLAAELMGWNNVFHCEIDLLCKKILNYYWPGTPCFSNIKEFNATPFKGKIDILTGGFPCQPFSSAGKRRGTKDNRFLWPDMLRIIREVKPLWVVAENVYGIVNWNEGLVFEQVHTDLEREGYEVQAFVLPAAGVNAPHRRYRVWFVAYSGKQPGSAQGHTDNHKRQAKNDKERGQLLPRVGRHGVSQTLTYTHHNGPNRRNGADEKQPGKAGQYAQRNTLPLCDHDTYSDRQGLEGRKASQNTTKERQKAFQQFARLCERGYWKHWSTQPPVCGRDDGLPRELDGITISKWRQESIKMYGNAIVPQVALEIFKTIEEVENYG